MSDLTTRYMGLTLKSPLVASASPLCESAENIGKLEDQGIAAVVLPSLFEEQLVLAASTPISNVDRTAFQSRSTLSRSAHL
jgi:dihydroorotate dehydrogenase